MFGGDLVVDWLAESVAALRVIRSEQSNQSKPPEGERDPEGEPER
jgi:hypothetical protein